MYRDFYDDNDQHGVENPTIAGPWYTKDEKFHPYWLKVMEEMIAKFQPDLLYTDGALPFVGYWTELGTDGLTLDSYAQGLSAVANLYNTSIQKHGSNQAVYLQKDRNPEVYKIGVLDIEKSQLPGIMPDPWHTDTCIGNWFYDVRDP